MDNALNRFNLKMEIVTGANANTNIAVAGITTEDQLVAVIEHDATSALPTDRTSTTSITSNGNIQCTVSTATDKLVVWWIDKSI